MNAALDDLVREVFELEDAFALHDTSGPDSVPGWDSLGTLKLVSAVEDRFAIELELEDIAELLSLADLRRIIGKYTAS